jgi:hypothetical protein
MDIGKFQILFILMHLTFSGCIAGVTDVGAGPGAYVAADVVSDGQVSGSLTANGESYPLKHIYTGRWNRQFQLLITNEPVSYETLSRIFLELNVSVTNKSESKTLKGSTLKALYFTQYESIFLNGSVTQTGRASFDGILMTSASFFQHGSVRFEAPSFKDGILRAKAANEFTQSFPGEDYQNIKMVAKYSFSFEAKIRSESLLSRSLSIENKAFQAGLASLPESGSAQGSLTASSTVVTLNYSYAMRQKVEDLNTIVRDLLRDKPGEVVTVLLTDKPIPREYLRFSFDRSVPSDVYGLYLYVDEAGQIRWSVIRYPSGRIGIADEATVKGFKFENGRVSGSAENRSSSIRVQDKPDGYSVSFEAPLKK